MSSIPVPLRAVVCGLLCAAAAADFGTVGGKVTLDGKPVAAGKVAFHPAAGKPVEARIDADGNFTARDVLLGDVPVTVDAAGVPKVYADPKRTPLRVTIRPGKQTADFDLRK